MFFGIRLFHYCFLFLTLLFQYSVKSQNPEGESYGHLIATQWFADTLDFEKEFMPLDAYLRWMDIQPGSDELREQSKQAILESHDSLSEYYVTTMTELMEDYKRELGTNLQFRDVEVAFELVRGVRHLYNFEINLKIKVKNRWFPVTWNFEAVWFESSFHMVSPIQEIY